MTRLFGITILCLTLLGVGRLTLSAQEKTARKKAASTEDPDTTPRPKRSTSPTPSKRKSTPKDEEKGDATPRADPDATPKKSASSTSKNSPPTKPFKLDEDEKPEATPRKKARSKETPEPKMETEGAAAKTTAAVDPAAPEPGKVNAAENATLDASDLVEFDSQPPRVKKLIESALALTKLNLTYLYGSADPSSGGMDCSGSIYYILRQNGINDVPRQASEQYNWVRKANEFDAVLSKNKQSFELDALKPGDLLFWTGTYSVDRDPPVTHSMIYLGIERSTKQRVMAGASDGRTYRGKSRWGVSVFDFQGGQTSRDPTKIGRGGFVGYATIPGLRDDAAPAREREQ